MAEYGDLAPRELAALAKGLQMLDDARLYGLVEGGPEIHSDWAQTILDRLAREGVVPSDEEAAKAAGEFMRQYNTEQERLRNA